MVNKIYLELSETRSGGARNVNVEKLVISTAELAQRVSKDAVSAGVKDGTYFLRGSCNGKRCDTAMHSSKNLLIVIDGDKTRTADGDISGAPDPQEVHAAMVAMDIEHVIYTSHSHHQHGENYNKWRLVIPSNASPANLKQGVDNVLSFLELYGIDVAAVKENYTLAQAWYWPRIDPNRLASYYSAFHLTGKLFEVPVNQDAPLSFTSAISSLPRPRVINDYNQLRPLREQLEKYGYTLFRGDKYLSPYSESGVAGVNILKSEIDGKERAYIHNTSDPLHGQTVDSFDLFCQFEHQGDQSAARIAAKELIIANSVKAAFGLPIYESCELLPFDTKTVDLEVPPGKVGEICRYLNASAKRSLPLIYPLVVLQVVSLVAGSIKGIDGCKLNLVTLAIAPSASGKEHGQAWFDRIARELDLGLHVMGGISSHKDMLQNLINANGRCSYKIDEVQGLFKAISSKNAASYESKIDETLLSLVTSESFQFTGLHRREFLASIEKEYEALHKELEKHKQDPLQLLKNASLISKCDARLQHLATLRDNIQQGWPNPIVSLMGHSTPNGLDGLVKESTINSGMIGRCIVIRCADTRNRLQAAKVDNDIFFKETVQFLKEINSRVNTPLTVSEEAQQLLSNISVYYDDDERLNAPVMGAIFARCMEQVNKVASLLGLIDGSVGVDHVRYAFALVKKSQEDIQFLLTQGEAQDNSASLEDILAVAREQVKRSIPNEGKSPSSLKQTVLRCNARLKNLVSQQQKNIDNSTTADAYDILIELMVKDGDIVFKDNGRRKRYFKCGL